MNKYDDTDYLIEREESIEYGKGTDANVGSIEEDIMSEEAFNELIDNFEVVETLTIYGRKAIKQNVKKLQKRIKELEAKNKLLLNSKVGIDLSYDDYIPRQKVEEILDKAEVMDYYSLPDVIEDLEKVLGVEDK